MFYAHLGCALNRPLDDVLILKKKNFSNETHVVYAKNDRIYWLHYGCSNTKICLLFSSQYFAITVYKHNLSIKTEKTFYRSYN